MSQTIVGLGFGSSMLAHETQNHTEPLVSRNSLNQSPSDHDGEMRRFKSSVDAVGWSSTLYERRVKVLYTLDA